MDDFDPNTNNQQEPSDAEWTTIDSTPSSEAGEGTENTRSEETFDHDEEWAEKSLEEVKAGLKQISNALKYAFTEGKNDPKIKQFGDDVRSAFEKISSDIADAFKKE